MRNQKKKYEKAFCIQCCKSEFSEFADPEPDQ